MRRRDSTWPGPKHAVLQAVRAFAIAIGLDERLLSLNSQATACLIICRYTGHERILPMGVGNGVLARLMELRKDNVVRCRSGRGESNSYDPGCAGDGNSSFGDLVDVS